MVEATNNNERRPDYARPPVVETIVGVQFERLPSLKNAHLGAFWRSLDRTEWISVDDAPPILSQFEQFAKTARWGKGLQLHLTQDPATRVQFKAEDGIRMIQVQNGRLHYNWLGKGGAEYPRYEKVRSGFAAVLQSFTDYIAGESLGELRPNQWEVTYLNHITQGTVWKTPQDWNFFKPLAGLPTIPDLVEGESFGGTWHFVIPQNRGRLHIEWKHAKG
ncbi:MAG: TIGR04255 family protein, partial [Phycisphaeraceae bacterium]